MFIKLNLLTNLQSEIVEEFNLEFRFNFYFLFLDFLFNDDYELLQLFLELNKNCELFLFFSYFEILFFLIYESN